MKAINVEVSISFWIDGFGILSIPDIADQRLAEILNEGNVYFAASPSGIGVAIAIEPNDENNRIMRGYREKLFYCEKRNAQKDVDGDVEYIGLKTFKCELQVDNIYGVVEAFFETYRLVATNTVMEVIFYIPFEGGINGKYFNDVMKQKGGNYNE